ncbi:phage repressor protein CI [Serratia ureilytica]|uniref:phage repressor protein CI n=1 Tax=Serratia ureilytica TaxID=300181 RepID=UPI0021A6ADA8|nr:phage repressor protein CI [Serratia ureilytica]MCT2268435.1 helix-turn-helix domain-containing protein [Serratia ureilytica]
MNLEKGGRGAIERMMEAYGFSTRQQLCEQLGVSKSTLATRYMRDSFPSDWVIQCSLETGASLRWLTTGVGVVFESTREDLIEIPRKKLINGKLYDSNFFIFDKALLPNNIKNSAIIISDGDYYLVDEEFEKVTDGEWLIDIDTTISIRRLIRLPNNKIKVTNNESSFECNLDDVLLIGKVRLKISEK